MVENMVRRYMNSADVTAGTGTNTTDIPVFQGECILSVVAGSTESVTIDVSYHQGGNAESAVTLISQETCTAGGTVSVLIPLGKDRRVPRGDVHVTWYGCVSGATLTALIGVGVRNE